jgi:hypothetical protein
MTVGVGVGVGVIVTGVDVGVIVTGVSVGAGVIVTGVGVGMGAGVIVTGVGVGIGIGVGNPGYIGKELSSDRPSSDSTESDAVRFVRRPIARWRSRSLSDRIVLVLAVMTVNHKRHIAIGRVTTASVCEKCGTGSSVAPECVREVDRPGREDPLPRVIPKAIPSGD